MIQRIDINKFGLFDKYDWHFSIGKELYFKKLNIIYGRNYSGKTTLSRVFRCIEKGEVHEDYCDAEYQVFLDDGTVVSQDDVEENDAKLKVRVYNSDFVKENLGWLHNTDGKIEPFTILGAVNVEIEKKLAELDEDLGSVDTKKGLLHQLQIKLEEYKKKQREANNASTALDEMLRKKAVTIKTDAGIYGQAVYQINTIKSDINKLTAESVLSHQQIDEKKKLLKEESRDDIAFLNVFRPNFQGFVRNTEDLLSKEITPTEAIVDLVSDAILQEWVRQGIEKHKGKRSSCGFCGQNLPADLWKKLDAHFIKESEELRDAIATAIKNIEAAKTKIDGFITLSKDLFYVDFQEQFSNIRKEWADFSKKYKDNLDKLITALRSKQEDIFSVKEFQEPDDVSVELERALLSINALCEENNRKTKTLKVDQQAAQLALRLSVVAEFIKEISYQDQLLVIEGLQKESKVLQEEWTNLQRSVDAKLKEQEKLKAESKDESKGAELVNQYLLHFFGHGELRLVATGDIENIKFKIQREGADANNLSEGECSLISFCYFIARMEDELQSDPDNLTIYIDDPISSLDSNHIFFIFSLIENVIVNPRKFKQLFISTHSLDFLKYTKRLTLAKDKKNEKKVGYFMIQRRGGNFTTIVALPPYLKQYVTEFNYLFGEIHACSIENEQTILLNHHYSFGNNLRKFLESLLYFKYPDQSLSLENRLTNFFGEDTLSVTLINRIVNEYSHLEEQFDRSVNPVDVDEIRKVAQLIMSRLKEKDFDQYLALCKSVGIKGIGEVPEVVAEKEKVVIEDAEGPY